MNTIGRSASPLYVPLDGGRAECGFSFRLDGRRDGREAYCRDGRQGCRWERPYHGVHDSLEARLPQAACPFS